MKRLGVICVLLGIISAGCATMPRREDAERGLSMDRIVRAAKDAFFDPKTMVPLIGAGVFAIDDFDESVSDWATKHHPIFGSGRNAVDTRKTFEDILRAEMYMTALAVPEESDDWVYSKLKHAGIEWAALRATYSITSGIKKATGRTRPNGRGNDSFPSGTTSVAFSYATLGNRNIDCIDTPWKKGLQFGNTCLASAVGWSRIESGAHYPSDVLAGAALGHFLSSFIYDVFLGKHKDDSVEFEVVPFDGGAMARVRFRF